MTISSDDAQIVTHLSDNTKNDVNRRGICGMSVVTQCFPTFRPSPVARSGVPWGGRPPTCPAALATCLCRQPLRLPGQRARLRRQRAGLLGGSVCSGGLGSSSPLPPGLRRQALLDHPRCPSTGALTARVLRALRATNATGTRAFVQPSALVSG